MDKRLERSLDENTGITEEFEKLSRDCFERIFDMLGRNNFERWIDKRKLAPRIKSLVIESMREDDKKKNPHWAGYYTSGKNRIRLGDTTPNTATHEKFHFIADNGDGFPTFIDEGITEYLKSMVEGRVTSYFDNVAIVKFLHQIVGDSIIKAYLLGAPSIFDKKVCSMLTGETPEQQKNAKEMLDEFYDNLNVFHEYNSAQHKYDSARISLDSDFSETEIATMKENAQNAKQRYLDVKDDILLVIQTLAVSKVTKMAENFEFYQNGALNISLINNTIFNVLNQMPIETFTKDNSIRGMLRQNVATLATREVIMKSHLIENPETEQDKIDELTAKLAPLIQYSESGTSITTAKISKDDPILKADSPKALETILNKFLNEGDALDITSYLEKLAILQEKFYISDPQMDYILTKHNIDRFSDNNNAISINIMIKEAFPVFRALYKLERQRERDTISTRETTFRDIGKNRYIEIRDNQRFYVEIGDDGSIYEEEIKYGHCTIFRGKERLDIDYKNGMEDVEVRNNGKKIKPGIPTSFREIKDLILSNAITKTMEQKIDSNEYTVILNDAPNPYEIEGIRYTGEVDLRSRKIDLTKFIQDLKSIEEAIPESVRVLEYINLAYSLLDRTYGTGPQININGFSRRDENVSDLYFEFRDNFEKMFDSNVKEYEKKKYLKRMEDVCNELNKIRKDRVTETSKTAAISFETPEAKNKYFKRLEQKSAEARIEEEKNLKKRIIDFDYGSCIDYIEDEEHPEFKLSGVYTTDDIDTTDRKIKIFEFAESIKSFLDTVPEDKRIETFDNIFKEMLIRAYRIGKINLENDKELAVSAENIKKALAQNVFDGKNIEDEVLCYDLELLNKFHKEFAEANKSHALIAFKDDNTRRMYDVIKNLLKSGTAESDIGPQVKTLIEIHNEMMKNKGDNGQAR